MPRTLVPRRRACVIIVENLPVPFDRHVWQQALALRDADWAVTVICPTGPSAQHRYERLEGIEIYRHGLPLEAKGGLAAYAVEYGAALFHELRLLIKIALKGRFDVIHACNPPDVIFLVAAPFKLLGVRFVFDQHDLSPELYESRVGRTLTHRMLLMFEKLSFRMADHVLASNETFREIALERGGKSPEEVSVVHTIPDAVHLKDAKPDATARRGKRLVVGYLGIIGFQDGLDHLVDAAARLHAEGLTDFQVVVIGDGPALESIRAKIEAADLTEHFTLTGYLSGATLWAHLADFDVGVIPDPRNAFNDKISMNKVFEYSALGIPIVSYKLKETSRLLGDAGAYAPDDTPAGLAEALREMLLDDDMRKAKGRQALAVAREKFDWAREASSLVAAYDRLKPPE